jgi:hypothetical protein
MGMQSSKSLVRDLRQHKAHGGAQVLRRGVLVVPHQLLIPLVKDLTTHREVSADTEEAKHQRGPERQTFLGK